MDITPDIVAASAAGRDGDPVVPHQLTREFDAQTAESDAEVKQAGPDEEWKFWDGQIRTALIHERRWRTEAMECEALYFGPDNDPGTGSAASGSSMTTDNKISDKVSLIHSNIEVLKPMLYSDTPQPVVRRRFRGDGKMDETDIMAAEAGQRIAAYMLDTEDFDGAMEKVRDDWLIAGRGSARVIYKATTAMVDTIDPTTFQPMQVEIKTDERVCPRYVEWRRLVLAPSDSWEQMPWLAFEVPMTRRKVTDRFGKEVADRFSFNQKGLVGQAAAISDDDRAMDTKVTMDSETGEPAINPFDTAMVWEIWNKEQGEVIWWSPSYRGGAIERQPDPLLLERFWPMPKPLLAATKGQQLTPRPSIKYYDRRAREIDLASDKLKVILDALSVSGLFPGQMAQEVQQLLSGQNKMIPVESWIALMEKGGTNNIIQWLPLNHMIAAIQALITLREQAKTAMFEASGISDIMRAQGDPNETATAQALKGQYSGLRLKGEQRRMAFYARDFLCLMVEIALEHFDTDRIADITALDLPMTEMERQELVAQQEAQKAQYAQLAQMYDAAQQQNAALEQQGMQVQPLPPMPPPPEFERIPETSWELVHDRLKSDYMRKITVTIETSSTIMADEQADKEARVEFLKAFATFVAELAPITATGQFDFKTVKELLMFGIRGFPKSRVLESLIASLPDEPQGEPPEDTQVTVAKIKAETDKLLKQMDMANDEADRQHETRMKGVDAIVKSKEMETEAHEPPPQNGNAK